MNEMVEDALRRAGRILLERFGQGGEAREKQGQSSIVTDADLASERTLLEFLRDAFPGDGILSEEAGLQEGRTGACWIVDPLDGTSNFAAGVPWFGILLARAEGGRAQLAWAYLPALDMLYRAEEGKGTFRNGTRVQVTAEVQLRRLLVAFAFDATPVDAEREQSVRLLSQVAARVRNVRATNSLVDACYTADGRFGGWVNLGCCLWDLAVPSLLLQEAGGILTDLGGKPIPLAPTGSDWNRARAVVGASQAVHPLLIAALAS